MSVLTRLARALRSDLLGGCLLIGAAVLAMVWANSPLAGSYEALRSFTIGPAALHLDLSLHVWAADGLLALFFFVVGVELKHELVHGELRDPRRATLPLAAAIGGVVLPAGVFLAFNLGQSEAVSGWGIPMATDIAFALAVLAIFGRKLPAPLRTFLLTLAVVDDLVAVLVIAVAYASGLSWPALLGAAAVLAVFGYLQLGRGRVPSFVAARVPSWLVYGALAVVIWVLTHESGVHATVAGVAMGLLMRTGVRAGESDSPAHRSEHLLRPVSAGFALPIFAMLSAGVAFSGATGFWATTVTWGILAGLVGGKFVGILGGAWLTARLTPAQLNPRIGWADIAGVAALGGIGSTVSLLIAELAYAEGTYLAHAKGATLLASGAATVLAAVLLVVRSRRHDRQATRAPEEASA